MGMTSKKAVEAILEAQKAGKVAAYIDTRCELNTMTLRDLGVDVEKLLVSQPDTLAQTREIVDTLLRSGAVDLVVVDSVTALMPLAPEGTLGIFWAAV